MLTIGIIGAGWLGNKWVERFKDESFIISNRQKNQLQKAKNVKRQIVYNIGVDTLNPSDWETCDFIVCMIPFSSRSTALENEKKAADLFTEVLKCNKPIFLISSTGIYPDHKKTFFENEIELNKNLFVVEQKLSTLPTLTILRLGGLMGAERHLSKYKKVGDEQVVNYIHYADVFHAVKHVFENKLWNKTFNLVAPLHPCKKDLIHYELTDEEIKTTINLKEQRIISSKSIEDTGFIFRHPNPLYFIHQ